jgi:hypothetical protein
MAAQSDDEFVMVEAPAPRVSPHILPPPIQGIVCGYIGALSWYAPYMCRCGERPAVKNGGHWNGLYQCGICRTMAHPPKKKWTKEEMLVRNMPIFLPIVLELDQFRRHPPSLRIVNVHAPLAVSVTAAARFNAVYATPWNAEERSMFNWKALDLFLTLI